VAPDGLLGSFCARRWWKLLGIQLLCALTVAIPVHAQKKIERRQALGMEGAIRIANMVGSVVVHGWNKDTVLVRGLVAPGDNFFMGGAYNGAKMFVESANERDPKPTRLEVWVPSRVRLWIKTATANIDVSDVSGGLDLYVVSGTIEVTGNPRELNAEAIDGDIHFNGSAPWLRAKSATGTIVLRGSSADVALSTVSGAIVVDGGSFERSKIETVTGNISFSGNLDRSGAFDFDTHSGTVDIVLPPKANASVSVVTIAGAITNRVTRGTPVAGRFGRGAELNTDYNGGGARLTVRSFKGPVILRQGR
jgi:formylmethanofuran dehydrogenase subunit C